MRAFLAGSSLRIRRHCVLALVAAVLLASGVVGPTSMAAATPIDGADPSVVSPRTPPGGTPAVPADPEPAPTPAATRVHAATPPSPPFISLNGARLGGTNRTSPMTVQVANAGSISGAVTWLLDDAYAGQDTSAPYEWRVVAPLGGHKLVARWVTTGTTTARATSEFTIQTDLGWKPPAEIREEPAAALEGLVLTGDNRRAAIPGVYDWSKAGFGGGTVLPGDANVRSDAGCRISAAQMISTYGVVPSDGGDDTAAIQAAIDHIRTACSATGAYTSMSRILLPAGTLNVSTEIHVDADYLIIRGAGSDPVTGTHFAYLPNADTRYDMLTSDGTRWDIDAMADGDANGGWIWPGRGLFRVQSRAVAAKYAQAYAAAPADRKDLYEGTVNDHWTTGLTLRGKPGDSNYAARKGDTVVHLDSASSFENVKVGGLVNVMAANSTNFYDEMGALPTDHELANLSMRQQIFTVTAGDPLGKRVTLDKPLEYDVPVTSTSDGSAAIKGKVTKSKLSPLVDAVLGVGIENLSLTQREPGLDPARAKDNYGNMDPAGAMHGVVLKWAANSWVTGIKTEMTGSHPIVTEGASHLSIVDNELDGAWNKGKGGNGYLRGSRVWDSVFAGNTMRNLRHFTFQWSASGNVAIGNSSDADLNLHGGYERNNLFELNEVATPFVHRPDSCWTNCGGEGSSGVDDADWYPIWWAAGKKAIKWSGSSGPNNVFFNNHMRKQRVNGTTPYTDYEQYSESNRIFQMGISATGAFRPLDAGGEPIPDWAGNETVDFSGHGVVSSRTDDGQSLFLTAPTRRVWRAKPAAAASELGMLLLGRPWPGQDEDGRRPGQLRDRIPQGVLHRYLYRRRRRQLELTSMRPPRRTVRGRLSDLFQRGLERPAQEA